MRGRFGDGVYFAEDIGKSDQYCGVVDEEAARDVTAKLGIQDADGARLVFVCRVTLGCFLQLMRSGHQMGDPSKSAFVANRRELAFVDGTVTPHHSAIAEIKLGPNPFQDTHTELEGNALRFREFIVFNSTQVYPEFLLVYKRVNK